MYKILLVKQCPVAVLFFEIKKNLSFNKKYSSSKRM
jgi:hypothetical protein